MYFPFDHRLHSDALIGSNNLGVIADDSSSLVDSLRKHFRV
jgi:hypothetical protein